MKSYFNKSLSKKLNLAYYTILKNDIINTDINQLNPFTKIIFNFKEIENLLEIKDQKIIKIFYFNRNRVHDILFEDEEIININYIEEKKTLSFYFYLDFLIKDNPLLNYTYSFNIIKQINDLQKNNNSCVFEQIIISKIIIDLINDYKQNNNDLDEIESKYKVKINEIENKNRDLINKNINIFESNEKIRFEIDDKALLSKKIDMIYIDILISLIKEKKFEDYEYILNIVNQLDLTNINITKDMFDVLSNFLNSENNIKCYKIENIQDLKNEKIINFYYILFKYILKNSIYIYNNNFLYKMKKKVIKLKPEKIIYELTNLKTDEISNVKFNKDRIKYVINTFLDSGYYYETWKNKAPISDEIKDNFEFTSNPFDKKYKDSNTKDDYMLKESKSKSNIPYEPIEEVEELYKKEISYRILFKSSYIFEVDENGISNFKINEPIKDNDDNNLEFNEIKEIIPPEDNELLKNSYYKFLNVFRDFEDTIKNYIDKDRYKNLKIELYFNLARSEKVKNNLYNINLIYIICNKKGTKKYFRDSNIFKYDSIDKGDGFLYLTNEINKL